MGKFADEKTLGITIEYQNKLCDSPFSFARSTGLEPDHGFIVMHKEDFKDFVITESVPGVNAPVDIKTQEKPGPGAPGFQSAGTLVYQLVEADGTVHRVTWEQILVTERGVEVAHPDDDDENEVVRVPLTDIRLLYATRGVVTGWVNVPKQGSKGKKAGGGTQEKPGSGTAGGPALLPGSTNNGEPWTVETVLKKKILPQLPGNPTLRIQKERPAFFDEVVGPKVWQAVLAKDAVQDVLRDFDLEFVLNLDASVSLWKKGEGALQLANGQQFATMNTSDANIDPRIATSRKLVTFRHAPPVVVVVGAPTIVETKTLLEPCGLLDGEIVPLADALKGLGLDMGTATKYALLTGPERGALLGISEPGLAEFNKYAFKWFRLPGGVEANAHRLPILNARAGTGAVGELLPVRVWSETFTDVNVLDLRHASTAGAAATRIKENSAKLKEIEEQLARSKDLSHAERNELIGKREDLQAKLAADAEIVKAAVGISEADLQAEKDAEAEAERTSAALQKAIAEKGFFAAVNGDEGVAYTATLRAEEEARKKARRSHSLAAKILEKLKTLKVNHYRVLMNVGFQEQSKGFEIDVANGVVKFGSLQGRIVGEGKPVEEGASLSEFAPIELQFAYRLKPGPSEDLSLDHVYRSVWVRAGSGAKALITQRDAIPPGSAPLVIGPLDELQEIRPLEGKSNKSDLDAIARGLAERQLHAEQSSEGAIVEFCRPVPVVNTGRVLSVEWACSAASEIKVTAHVGTFAPLAPAPHPHRREARHSVLDGAVHVPRGLAR